MLLTKTIPDLRGLALALLALTLSAACGGAPEASPTPPRILPGKSVYSSHNEEILIRSFFNDRRGGFFLDVGCYLPVRASNTYYLEQALGWSGIAVDALAEFAPAWKKRRPKSKFFAFMVSDESETVAPFFRSELRDASSVNEERVSGRSKKGKDLGVKKLEVPTITLTKLLEDNSVERIDLLTMDIEGAEPKALAGFDVERFRPELACVEVSPATRATIRSYFAGHGYRLIEAYLSHDPFNEYYTPATPPPAHD